jgi:hypothetical protein
LTITILDLRSGRTSLEDLDLDLHRVRLVLLGGRLSDGDVYLGVEAVNSDLHGFIRIIIMSKQ